MKTVYILALAIAAALTARADFSYTQTRKSAGGAMGNAMPMTIKTYFKGDKMAIVTGSTVTMIMDFAAQTQTIINNQQKTYTVTKFSDFGQQISEVAADVKMDMKETGQRKTINGFDCKEVIMTIDLSLSQGPASGMKSQMEIDTWASSDVPGNQERRAFFQKYRSQFPWAAMAGADTSIQKAMADVQRKMATIDGIPVLQIMKMKTVGGPQMSDAQQQQLAAARAKMEEMAKQGGPQGDAAKQALARMGAMSGGGGSTFETTMESSDFSTGPVSDSVFAIPAGFTKTERK